MASTTSAPQGTTSTGRGPAPPLPEKPPSVAERTRLLRSSFRKDELDKPKVGDNKSSLLSEKSATLPSQTTSNNINGTGSEKSETPSPASSVGSITGISGVGRFNNDKMATVIDSNKEQHARSSPAVSPPPISAAKREAFFKGDSGGPTTKFDPTSRFGTDRERPRDPPIRDLDDREKEREKKYGDSTKELDGYVGFANLPNQVYRKSVKRGFEFTLMVVGESGLGKSTLINSLFLTDLYAADYPGPSLRIQKTVKVETTHVSLKENGVQLRLTVVDTPGFGDAVDNSNCWQPVTDFIDNKYDEYLNSESRVNRTTTPDTRVHCCLYFIAPTGHGLKPLDVEFMKRLHDKVNIIPLIAKADTLTPDECREFKKTILNEIAQHKIKIYEFPECEDEEENKLLKKLRDRVPFAVVGSNRVIEAGGKRVRGRQYPWGIVEVENLEHNDFIALRNMLIRDPLSQMAEEKKEHDIKMKKMEAEMEQVFEMKVKEKKIKLKDSEADLQRRTEQSKKALEQQQKELEERIKQFEKEKHEWEDSVGLSKGSLENVKEYVYDTHPT
ncbi:hypothetical protein KUTeg_018858 [Tegillarca granosa]|uniref:Septin-type G domain-containing protein n=1 Tax=Tegillarca granosa TaxID=220873 RepID=A0ABQ9EEY1_TEGGR|nr:hypothetical protein KUTeg_018858 [Tegillarca granosa]